MARQAWSCGTRFTRPRSLTQTATQANGCTIWPRRNPEAISSDGPLTSTVMARETSSGVFRMALHCWLSLVKTGRCSGIISSGPTVQPKRAASPGESSDAAMPAGDRADMFDGEPALGDLDRDGTEDVLATVISSESYVETDPRGAESDPETYENEVWRHRRTIVAISGRSGRRLWSYAVNTTLIDIYKYLEICINHAVLVPGRRWSVVGCVDGTKWVGLDPATGRLRYGPIELGNVPDRRVQYADLDGDGDPEIVAVGPGPSAGQAHAAGHFDRDWSALWTQAIDGHFDQSKWGVPVANIPLVVDLAALGRPGIVVADSGAMPPLSGYRGLRLIDGRTGTTRWRRAMRPQTAGADGLAHVIVAPDLDGDGMRDLITVSGFVGRTPPVAPRGETGKSRCASTSTRSREETVAFSGSGSSTCRSGN